MKIVGFFKEGEAKGVHIASEKILSKLGKIRINGKGKIVKSGEFGVDRFEIFGDFEKDSNMIYRKAFDDYRISKMFFLGGDHSISYFTARAFFDYCDYNGKKPCLIVFDSQPNFKGHDSIGSKRWLRRLIEDGFPVENILLVGIRNIDFGELRFLLDKGIKMMRIEEFMFDLEAKTDAIMEFGYGKDVYVSCDISCVDPAFAPGCSTCEPGGFSSREFLYIARRLSLMKNLRVVDLVEIDPDRDVNGMTVGLGAKIMAEFF